ncbi:MAG: fluoride efflux transporter CrcB [Geitlerinemataceae cyanobacterium]
MLDWSGLRPPLAIALGAIGGSLARYYVSQAIASWSAAWGAGFPYGTAIVNVSGAIAMGVLATLAARHFPSISPEVKLIIGTGFLGSYTTFSTYALESVSLWSSGRGGLALVYWLGSAVLGLVGVGVGVGLGNAIGRNFTP